MQLLAPNGILITSGRAFGTSLVALLLAIAARFERRRGDNHHHLVCTHCGRVEDTDCKHGHAPCLTPDDAQGFVIHEAEILFWGVCSRCRANTETRPDKA